MHDLLSTPADPARPARRSLLRGSAALVAASIAAPLAALSATLRLGAKSDDAGGQPLWSDCPGN